MKRIFLIAPLLFILLSACKKTPLDLLPPATQEGLNTFGCLIDGKECRATHNPKLSTDWHCYPKCEFLETGLSGQRIHVAQCESKDFGSMYIYI